MNFPGPPADLRDVFTGVLLGTAVGDALGLPAENLSPGKIHRRWRGEWRMRLLFGRGMISDDTEHTLMVAQALLSYPDDAAAFQRVLGWKLRWWFAGLPGGVGFATAKACLRLWAGFPAHKAAVASAGSGPAMRSAIIGAYFADDAGRRKEFVSASSHLTHRGWQAEIAAQAVAECVALTARTRRQPEVGQVLDLLRGLSGEGEWREMLTRMESALVVNRPVAEFVQSLGLGKGSRVIRCMSCPWRSSLGCVIQGTSARRSRARWIVAGTRTRWVRFSARWRAARPAGQAFRPNGVTAFVSGRARFPSWSASAPGWRSRNGQRACLARSASSGPA